MGVKSFACLINVINCTSVQIRTPVNVIYAKAVNSNPSITAKCNFKACWVKKIDFDCLFGCFSSDEGHWILHISYEVPYQEKWEANSFPGSCPHRWMIDTVSWETCISWGQHITHNPPWVSTHGERPWHACITVSSSVCPGINVSVKIQQTWPSPDFERNWCFT